MKIKILFAAVNVFIVFEVTRCMAIGIYFKVTVRSKKQEQQE